MDIKNDVSPAIRRAQTNLSRRRTLRSSTQVVTSWVRQHRRWSLLLLVLLLLGISVPIWLAVTHKPKETLATNPVIASYQKQLPTLKQETVDHPKDAVAHRNYAIALYVTRDLSGAQKQYETAIQLDDKDAASYNNLGNAYRDDGKIDQAIAAYQSSLARSSSSVNTYANLANIQLYSKHDPKAAIATYQQGLNRLPDNPQLEILLGIAYEQAGDTAKAKQTYQAVLQKDKNNTAAQANLARLSK